MIKKIILASKSKVRKKILEENNIDCIVEPSNIDEDQIKESLLKKGATPEIISKNLAELKANKISKKKIDQLVLGADSIIDLEGEIIFSPSKILIPDNSSNSIIAFNTPLVTSSNGASTVVGASPL